jgi:hypothetical protein
MADERRQGRAEVVAAERRRRGDSELRKDASLPIPPEVAERLKKEGLVPRWVNDEGNRMHRFTVQDDYDPVDGVEPVPVGVARDGKPILARLVAKRKDFIEADREAADKRRRETEESLVRGKNPQEAANPNPGTAQRYVDEATSIRRGNQILE